MFERMSRQFEDMPWNWQSEFGEQPLWSESPSVDLAERDEEYVVTVDLPGFDKDEITVQLSDRTLQIKAERSEETDQRDERFIRQERSHRSVSRSISIPEQVREDDVSASYNNGVLTVTLPKTGTDGESGRRIDIE